MSIERRAHTRIEYSASNPPTLTVGAVDLRVRDCSERGLSFAIDGKIDIVQGSELSGFLRFPDGRELLVDATVVWVASGNAGAWLSAPGISPTLILDERARLAVGAPDAS
jgi:hypothetical protein